MGARVGGQAVQHTPFLVRQLCRTPAVIWCGATFNLCDDQLVDMIVHLLAHAAHTAQARAHPAGVIS